MKHFKRKIMRNRQELVLLTKSIEQGYKKDQPKWKNEWNDVVRDFEDAKYLAVNTTHFNP